jgi:hypothetical protein
VPTPDPYGQGISTAALTDAPNAQTLAQNIVNAMAPMMVMRFASASARSATLTGVAAPVEGMVSYLADVDTLSVYTGGTWQVMAPQRSIGSQFAEDATTRSTTSQTFGFSSFTLSAAVTVPASGKVAVEIRCTQRNSSTLNSITSFAASGSTSGTVYTENDTAAIIVGGTTNVSLSLRQHLAGLTVGETLTVTMRHRVSAPSTATIDYRSICLEGLPS